MAIVLNSIWIFKTNIVTVFDKLSIQDTLNDHPGIEQWNVDLHDIDCVLRIVSRSLTADQIILIINGLGFACTELE